MLKIKNIEVVYNEVVLVIKGLSLEVNEGEIVSLLGANGAGKSTLLKLISREISPTDGEVIIPKETSIGYLKQEITFNTNETIFNVWLTHHPKFRLALK